MKQARSHWGPGAVAPKFVLCLPKNLTNAILAVPACYEARSVTDVVWRIQRWYTSSSSPSSSLLLLLLKIK